MKGSAMKGLRPSGMVLMCLWILNGAGHVLLGLMGDGNVAFHLYGGIAQVAVAVLLLLKIHALQPGVKATSEAKIDESP